MLTSQHIFGCGTACRASIPTCFYSTTTCGYSASCFIITFINRSQDIAVLSHTGRISMLTSASLSQEASSCSYQSVSFTSFCYHSVTNCNLSQLSSLCLAELAFELHLNSLRSGPRVLEFFHSSNGEMRSSSLNSF